MTPTDSNSQRSSNSLRHTSNNPSRHRSSTSFQRSITLDKLLNHSHLKPGDRASLLSYTETISMYRDNAKRTNDQNVQYDFAIFLVEAAKRIEEQECEADTNTNIDTKHAYLLECEKILKPLVARGHSEAQYYLANMYASGDLVKDKASRFSKAFPLFVQAAKHHHADSAFRVAKCYEDGLGCRKDNAKAVQFYRKAASLNHPGAMYRIGIAELQGTLSLSRNVRDAHKWLKRSAESATVEYPHALHELALLHENGIPSLIFEDHLYAIQLYKDAAKLHYAPSAFRLGECYEFGLVNCQPDQAMSIFYYNQAAKRGHAEACLAMSLWCLSGVPNVIGFSEPSAYSWALVAAEKQLPKAEYAVGYFCQKGIGRPADIDQAVYWYTRASDHGEKRALKTLQEMGLSPQNRGVSEDKPRRASLLSSSSLSRRISLLQPSWKKRKSALETAQAQ
ncbi:hypothetical protein BDF14DRAFT_1735006 [Spinellus fusiger]|nr:hypothetical protein BDF14DRAFT_1735006 [Spinellus fusiger]